MATSSWYQPRRRTYDPWNRTEQKSPITDIYDPDRTTKAQSSWLTGTSGQQTRDVKERSGLPGDRIYERPPESWVEPRVGQPPDYAVKPPGVGEHIPTQPPPGDTQPPGTPPPEGGVSPKTWDRFELWQPQGGTAGLYWNPDYRVPIPSGQDEQAIQDAHFLNWFNQMVPYLAPRDMAALSQQVNQAIDSLTNAEAKKYFSNLADAASNRGLWQNSAQDYWDRDRLREVRRMTEQYFSDVAGGKQLREWERYAQDITDLLDLLLGVQATGGSASPTGYWSEDRPMTRRERRGFWDTVNTYLGGVDESDPFANVLMALLSPTTDIPRLSTYIHAPATYMSAPVGTQRTYGYSNPRYL